MILQVLMGSQKKQVPTYTYMPWHIFRFNKYDVIEANERRTRTNIFDLYFLIEVFRFFFRIVRI